MPIEYMTLSIDSKVFYPAHGAGWVRSLKEIEFGGEKKSYYEFEFINNPLVISTPVEKVVSVGVRPVVSPTKIRSAIKTLKNKSNVKPPVTDFNKFITHIKELDLQGDVSSFIEIIQFCNYIKQTREKEGRLVPLSINKYIKSSATHITSELAVAEGVDFDHAAKTFLKITDIAVLS